MADDERPSGRPVPDDALREFKSALAGKPDTQFSEAVPPDFRKVLSLAEEIFARSRDLTVAVGWSRAALRHRGIAALPQGLRLLNGLLENFREDLHPQADPDDGSFYARANAVSVLAEIEGLLGDLRQAVLISDRMHGEIRMRTIEIALKKLDPREDETPLTTDQLKSFFASSAGGPALRELLVDARTHARALATTLGEQMDALDAPNLSPLLVMIDQALQMIPQADTASEAGGPADAGEASPGGGFPTTAAAGQALNGAIHSRADVVRALDMVCDYLERAEPTNPAQLLLRRAKLLLDQNFLQLIHVLAPNALDDVAKLMGVDPASITASDNG